MATIPLISNASVVGTVPCLRSPIPGCPPLPALVLPLMFKDGMDRKSLGITGEELIDIVGLENAITPRMDLSLVIHRPNGKVDTVPVICRIDTVDEVAYYRHGGILHYVLRSMAKAA